MTARYVLSFVYDFARNGLSQREKVPSLIGWECFQTMNQKYHVEDAQDFVNMRNFGDENAIKMRFSFECVPYNDRRKISSVSFVEILCE